MAVNGTRTDFREPQTGAYLRVDHVSPPGRSPQDDWVAYERTFGPQHTGYRRVQMTPTTYQGLPASDWEFTYQDGATSYHAVDLGFVTRAYGFALNFQTREADWVRLQPFFDGFKASFRPPP